MSNSDVVDEKTLESLQYDARILCLGDSWTEGLCEDSVFEIEGEDGKGQWVMTNPHPYAMKMRDVLNKELGWNVRVDINAVSGDCVHPSDGKFRTRLSASLSKAEKEKKEYSHVIVLGGLNDLVEWQEKPEDVFQELKGLWESALLHGEETRVFGCTLPEIANPGNEEYADLIPLREKLNKLIRGYCNGFHPRLKLLDLDRKYPLTSLPDAKRKELWQADGVHPRRVGYDALGELVGNTIVSEFRSRK
ncbi:hypothetical protein M427DRAFT_155624 [Gonapodya prolifera JEL478]|uniref:SGNH hydrolase-type esterase domain-containing protein n=1 Tax=Gonapodya prolifera (strain JEL478) TaxID=1344416 RepID=A0A139ADQ3_GONPJ|nr:hypothetical protein M427DRAFT_155624 [Gonapodya prolifera JEL478]|eukprot:KXS14956.1 hypothetical protein M427DRAFT_155624 [Gonapodya prolifera JEL478]